MLVPARAAPHSAKLLATCASLIHMRILVPLVAALVPLLIIPGAFTYFDVTPKIAFLLLGTALILLYRRQYVGNVRIVLSTPLGRWWVGLLAAQWLSSAVATAFSSYFTLSLNGGIWRRFGLIEETALLLFVLPAAGWLASDRKNLHSLLRASTASGAVAALYGIAQYIGFDPLLPVNAYHAGEGRFTIVRPPGTLGHADYFSAWMLVIVFFAMALRLEESGWWKRAASATAGLAAFSILLSGTRSALLGLLAGAIVLLVCGRFRLRTRGAAYGLAAMAGLALFFFSPAGAMLRARLHWSLEDLRGGGRLLLWRDSVRMAAQRPLSGFGPETFITEFPRFESLELARAYPDFYQESPHNLFLDQLAGRGVAGLAVLLGLCGLGVWAAVGAVRAGHPLGAPLFATFAGLLVTQQFMVLIVPTALYFYFSLSALVAIAAPVKAKEAGGVHDPARWLLAPAAGVAVLLVVVAARLVMADAAFAVAERRIRAGNVSGAAQAYRTVLRWQLKGAGSDLRYSRDMQDLAGRSPLLATRLEARQEALKAGIAATRTAEDRQNAWYNLATLFAAGNDAVSIEHSLRNAMAWAPNWFKPHWTLAQLLAMTGRPEEALAEASAAVERDGGRDAEVTQTQRQLMERRARP